MYKPVDRRNIYIRHFKTLFDSLKRCSCTMKISVGKYMLFKYVPGKLSLKYVVRENVFNNGNTRFRIY